ncbi:hypothetical protein [Streptomyces sp. NBC_00310]|uniref:hypothetical protein n=1 Tax=unclassified Streptomyces TaxID=2593676 RepID=UPI003FA774B1
MSPLLDDLAVVHDRCYPVADVPDHGQGVCFLADTGKGLTGHLRPWNAGANAAADHITLLDRALT